MFSDGLGLLAMRDWSLNTEFADQAPIPHAIRRHPPVFKLS